MKENNIQMLEDTLRILKNCKYIKGGKTVYTKLSKAQMEECYVYLPNDIQDIMKSNRIYSIWHLKNLMMMGG